MMRKVFLCFFLLLSCFIAFAAQPQSVKFSENEITIDLAVSDSYTLSGTVYPQEASQQLNWYSSNEKLLTVKDGVIQALHTGEGSVRANVPGITAIGDKCIVHIVDSRLPKKLTINGESLTIEPGASARFFISADHEGADTAVKWIISDIRIATVSSDGTVTGIKPGQVRLTAVSAASEGVSAQVILNIGYLPKPVSLSVSNPAIVGSADSEHTVSYEITPASASKTVSFESSDTDIADVDEDGVVTLKSVGTCLIKVYMTGYPEVFTQVTVSVSDKRAPERVLAYPAGLNLEPSNRHRLEAIALPVSCPSVFRYTSTNEKVAVVDNEGIVTAISEGSCVIRVYSAYNKSVYCDVPVTVKYGTRIKSVAFVDKAVILQKGETIPASYTVNPENGSRAIELTADDPSVIRVNPDGTITALKFGSTTLTAVYVRDVSIRSTMSVTVEDIDYPDALIVTPSNNLTLDPGESISVNASAVPDTASSAFIVSSSRPDIVSLSGTTLTALKRGVSDITITSPINDTLSYSFRITVEDGTNVLTMPARRTDESGIQDNLAAIERLRQCTEDEINLLFENGEIDETEKNGRIRIINNAFSMYSFPWTVAEEQRYWKAENSQDGAKNFKPGIIYYGLPYTSGINDNRAFTVERALNQERYIPVEGKEYFLLNQNDPRYGHSYVGNDCSAFVALCMFGSAHDHGEIVKTGTLFYDDRLQRIDDAWTIRPGDIMVKHSSHVVMFLYWADEAHTQAVFIEQGGSEYAINTVVCTVYEFTYYSENYYRLRRMREF